MLGETARFTDKQVHLLKETHGEFGRSYCGLNEREGVWREPDEGVTCSHCLRALTERVNEIGAKVDSIRIGPEGALYPS